MMLQRQIPATDLLGAEICAFFAQLACEECGSAPDLATQRSDLVPVHGGAWLLAGFTCTACRKAIIGKVFLAF